jgi:hypothetical protein
MDINDYLLPVEGTDWRALLVDWLPELPDRFTLWLVNRFGDLFFVLDDGTVCGLDVRSGRLTRLAGSREEFGALLDAGDHAEQWLQLSLVDACVAAGLVPAEGQCYGFRQPLHLGGAATAGNVEVLGLPVHYALLAELRRRAPLDAAPAGNA